MFRCTFQSLFLLFLVWREFPVTLPKFFFGRIYAHTISLFRTLFLASFSCTSRQLLLDGVFDCNQNWLIFMRFYSRCCFSSDHFRMHNFSRATVGILFNYTKVTLSTLAMIFMPALGRVQLLVDYIAHYRDYHFHFGMRLNLAGILALFRCLFSNILSGRVVLFVTVV
jgi:hypothetical protein